MNKYTGLAFILGGLTLSGCIPALVTAGATTGGVVAAQERSAGNAMDDAGIKLAIDNLYLNKDINDLLKNVYVRVSEGRVLLAGDVDKPETKIDAVNLAWKVNGVREVIDEIQVNDKTGFIDYARDSWIDTQIRSRLLLEKNLRSINYNVETVNGTVYLLGIAQDKEELDKASYIAATTKYVKQVVSHVLLRDDPRRRPYTHHDDSPPPTPHGPDDNWGKTPGGQPAAAAPDYHGQGQNGDPGADQGYSGGGQPETAQHMHDTNQQ